MSDDQYNPADDRPHVPDGVCGKCRKEFGRGHRVTIVNIVEGTGINPSNLGQRGLFLFKEWELVHVDCKDPLLKKGLP